jgi:hypothetical protein
LLPTADTLSGTSTASGLAIATRAAVCVRTGHSSASVPRLAGGVDWYLTS